MPLRIRFPVVGIALQDQPLARDVFLQTKWAESRPSACGGCQRPSLVKLYFLVGLFEEMPRQDVESVKEPLSCSVGLRKLKDQRVGVQFSKGDRLTPNNQEIALRGVDLFVKVDAESEDDVIGIHWMTV